VKWTTDTIAPYLVSLPERVLRSASALAGGLVREIGEVTIPSTIRRSHLYQNLVEATLRFLIEQVGEVDQVYPPEQEVAEDFLLRRTAGGGIEFIGILAFRASPVWVLAALADASGAGRYLIREITDSLKEARLLEAGTSFTTVDQMLDGLEGTASRLAATVNEPPLDVVALRREWESVRKDLAKIPPSRLPPVENLRAVWKDMKQTAQQEKRTVFEVSSLMAMSAIAALPQKTRWISASARLAASKTGAVMSAALMDHYRATLKEIQQTGYLPYAVRQFRPYLYAAAAQFAPAHRSLTERWLFKKNEPKL
jgi:hypothetical protein